MFKGLFFHLLKISVSPVLKETIEVFMNSEKIHVPVHGTHLISKAVKDAFTYIADVAREENEPNVQTIAREMRDENLDKFEK